MQEAEKKTDSGIEIKKVYTCNDLPTNLNETLLPLVIKENDIVYYFPLR